MPAPQLLAHNLDVTQAEVADMEKRLTLPDLSLDQPIYEDGEETMLDMVRSDGDIEDLVEEREKQKIASRKITSSRRR